MSSSKKKHELDRRAFLKRILAGTGMVTSFPGEMFLSNMMLHFLQKGYAHAAGFEVGLEDMKLINIGLNGGLPRWYWDSVLRPAGNDPFISNPMVISRFKKSGNSVLGEYATTRIGGYHLPWIWNATIPRPGGGTVPMSSLAQHMLSLRGINTMIDSHDLNKPRHLCAVPGGASLTGLVADNARTPIPAIDRKGGADYYGSKKGIAAIGVKTDNDPLTALLTPFLPGTNVLELKNGQIEAAIDNALLKMNALTQDKNKFLPSSFEARQSAKRLMKKKFSGLQSSYSALRNKYQSLINACFNPSGQLILEGVDDIDFPGAAHPNFKATESEYFIGNNIQDITTGSTGINDLAESMAVAEFMLKENLSSAVNLIIGSFSNVALMRLENLTTGAIRSPGAGGYTTDVHFTGSHVALILFSRYYRALSACLYELISQLKSVSTPGGNMFNQTAITITSEFNRSARNDGAGADHGWNGQNYTIFSGAVDRLTVLGNIQTTTTSKTHGGTWGVAGGLKELSGREAILGNAISTVSTLVKVPTPAPNDQSFVALNSAGKITPVITSCQNVDDEGEAA